MKKIKMKKIILMLALTLSSGAFAASEIQQVQFDLLGRAEVYCADEVGRKSPKFNACVEQAYSIGWNRYKEAVELSLAQQRFALEQKAAKERREAEGWAQLQQAAQMAAPVRYGTTCQSRSMTAGSLTTQCF